MSYEKCLHVLRTEDIDLFGGYPFDYAIIEDKCIMATVIDGSNETLLRMYRIPEMEKWEKLYGHLVDDEKFGVEDEEAFDALPKDFHNGHVF